MKGLAPHTSSIFETLSKLECIKPYVLKSKNLIAMLTRGDRFLPDSHFDALNPIYLIGPQDIENRIKTEIESFDR